MQTHLPLQHGNYYHIYNRGNNREDLFRESDNYLHFLRLYEKYICPIAHTYAWVLMKNHFHLLVQIKEVEEMVGYKLSNADRSVDPVGFKSEKWETVPNLSASAGPDRLNHLSKKPDPTRHFAHLFNAYAKYINKRYSRTGSLFETPFRRKQVWSVEYFRQLVIYIHRNPEHHGFSADFKDYPWSSYGSILSVKPTHLCRQRVIGWFDDCANFVAVHKHPADMGLVNEIMIE
jgi:putative transposase